MLRVSSPSHSNVMFLIALMLSLSGCASTIHKLSKVGEKPDLTTVENPQVNPNYKPISWPMPDPEIPRQQTSNSLWQSGSRAFFRDQRAGRVGDILRVNVSIADQAKLDNKTNRQRSTSDTMAAPQLLGAQKLLSKIPGVNPLEGNLIDTSGSTNQASNGKIDRKETINTQIAALVTQVLPNGNLVIEGSQEILVNYEIREVSVRGVIRPEDIKSDNTIESSQIAEARFVYSGRGQVSDIEQPRWGTQIIEAISPF